MSQLRLFLLGVLLTITPMVAHTVKAAEEVQIVTLETNLGTIQIEMLSDDAPETVKNFLNYVNRGDFDGTFFHRRPKPLFVLQGGGFSFEPNTSDFIAVESDPPILNEFKIPNTRGTVAMAKLDGDPNSATNQWFFNLIDNPHLDSANGGFTVFGRVIGSGMDVVDDIAALPVGEVLGLPETPTINYKNKLTADIFVTIVSASLDEPVAAPAPAPPAFTIDTSATAPITGLWWGGDSESGWGMALTQQVDIIFATIFTYIDGGIPKWYVVSNCVIQGDGCNGEIIQVVNGTSILDPWQTLDPDDITSVGSMNITFTDNDTGSMTFDIDGASGTKNIIRQEFGISSPGEPMTGLWWNPDESGWGVSLTRRSDIAFATMFTYDEAGFPAWFVVSNCEVSDTGCTGDLFQVTGGSALTVPWVGPVNDPIPVASLTFNFTDDDNGTLEIKVNDSTITKTITRQSIAADTDADGVSDKKDNCPDIANADQLDVDENGTGDACEP